MLNLRRADEFQIEARLTGTQLNGFSPLGQLHLWDSSQGAFSDTKLANVGDLTGWTMKPGRLALGISLSAPVWGRPKLRDG